MGLTAFNQYRREAEAAAAKAAAVVEVKPVIEAKPEQPKELKQKTAKVAEDKPVNQEEK